MKHFIITIDTEGDNLWDHRPGDSITTTNARFIPRFQDLCDTYNFKPVYLVNYEMSQDHFFVDLAKKTLAENKCEIGIHPHAWNNPPLFELQKTDDNCGLPYLIEYPLYIMRDKFTTLYQLLKETFRTDIVTHRSGRWAMDQNYFDILIDNGIKIDCSVTPHVSWENAKGLTTNSRGSDYRNSLEEPYLIKHSSKDKSLTEIPVTIRKSHNFSIDRKIILKPKYIARTILNIIIGKPIWLRPAGNNLSDMLMLVNLINNSSSNYLMFMLHSSELMPGGSPKFKTTESIETLYCHLKLLFDSISKNFQGSTLKGAFL